LIESPPDEVISFPSKPDRLRKNQRKAERRKEKRRKKNLKPKLENENPADPANPKSSSPESTKINKTNH
jgi:hemolysin activation/secretion protein